MSKNKNKWVVYPEVEVTIDELKNHLNMQENDKLTEEQNNTNKTELEELVSLADEVKTKIAESTLPADVLQTVETHVDELIDLTTEEKMELVEVDPSEVLDDELPKEEIPTSEVPEEKRELTDEEKHAILIEQLKASKIKYRPVKHPVKNGMVLTNVLTNQFGAEHRKERKRKNRQKNKSRKVNR